MNRVNRRNLFQRGNDIFAWLHGFELEVPKDRRTTLGAQLKELRDIIKLLGDYVKTEHGCRCLKFCGEEIDKSEILKKNNKTDEAMKSWRSARQLFQDAEKDEEFRARFVVGPAGEIQDSNNPAT